MGRPLNMDEVTWLKSEIERLKRQSSGGGDSDKTEKLRALLQELYDAHVQCEGYNPNKRIVHKVQLELGIL
jgi:hypothetical protein